MKRSFLFILILLSILLVQCQEQYVNTSLNLDMETVTHGRQLPDGWFVWGQGFDVKKDTEITYQGKTAISVSPQENAPEKNFACATYVIPAKYTGKEIELKAHIKMENVADGQIGLLLRIDGEKGILEFTNMQEKNIHGTAGWTEYSVKLSYPEEAAKSIYVGAMLNGTGKIWADNFQVLIDGRDIRNIDIRKEADKDNDFADGSKINNIEPTKKNTETLKTVGLIWGFLKYYHPAIATGNYNWDNELFRRLPGILAAKDNAERDIAIYNWVLSLGKFEEEGAGTKPIANIKIRPDLDWIENSGLDKDLVYLLLKVKKAKREDKGYYINLTQGVQNPIFQNERPYESMQYSDAGFRLLALYRYWNMIQYFFPYKNLIEEDWKDVLEEFIPKFLTVSDELGYKLACLELIVRINDTHATVPASGGALLDYWGLNYAAYLVKFVEGEAVVNNYHDKEKGIAGGLQIGDVITAVDGRPVKDIYKEKKKYIPASNEPTRLRNFSRYLLRTGKETMEVEYIRDGKKGKKTLKTYHAKDFNHASIGPDSCFSIIDKNIAYLYPAKLKNNLAEVIKGAEGTKGLIVDFRCYPSEFIVFSLGRRLVKENTPFVKFTRGDVRHPGYFVMGDPLQLEPDKENYYGGKIVILIDETTQSSAEYTTMALRAGPDATVIGSTTAGADGNVSQIILPGGVYSMISGIGVYYPDESETQRVGIIPDIEMKPTIEGIRTGRDEVLEKAIELINRKIN